MSEGRDYEFYIYTDGSGKASVPTAEGTLLIFYPSNTPI